MPSAKQSAAATKNIKKAAATAKKKRTIVHLPKATRTAASKPAGKVAKQNVEPRNNLGIAQHHAP